MHPFQTIHDWSAGHPAGFPILLFFLAIPISIYASGLLAIICVVMFAVILAVKALEHSTIPLPASDRWVLRVLILFMLPNYISLMVGFFLFTEVREGRSAILR